MNSQLSSYVQVWQWLSKHAQAKYAKSMQKIGFHCLRFSDYAELGLFKLLFCRGWQVNVIHYYESHMPKYGECC